MKLSQGTCLNFSFCYQPRNLKINWNPKIIKLWLILTGNSWLTMSLVKSWMISLLKTFSLTWKQGKTRWSASINKLRTTMDRDKYQFKGWMVFQKSPKSSARNRGSCRNVWQRRHDRYVQQGNAWENAISRLVKRLKRNKSLLRHHKKQNRN